MAEVFHAYFPRHAYPLHTHDTWALLIIDTGVVRYDLDRHEHGALRTLVTLLPPHVPHDGRTVHEDGFRKRVVYLDEHALDASQPHLVRSFTREHGIAPHQYLTGRRLDLARHLLLAGCSAAEVAAEAGFYDQAHLTRHFTRLLGVPPGVFARGA